MSHISGTRRVIRSRDFPQKNEWIRKTSIRGRTRDNYGNDFLIFSLLKSETRLTHVIFEESRLGEGNYGDP